MLLKLICPYSTLFMCSCGQQKLLFAVTTLDCAQGHKNKSKIIFFKIHFKLQRAQGNSNQF